jgi:DNA repair protein RadC
MRVILNAARKPDIRPHPQEEDAILGSARAILAGRIAENRPRFPNFRDVRDYLAAHFSQYSCEVLAAVCLDRESRLIEISEIAHGTSTWVSMNTRELVKRALVVGACGIVVAHNHPQGPAAPSSGDIEMTRFLRSVLSPLDIELRDHFIISGGAVYSMLHHAEL